MYFSINNHIMKRSIRWESYFFRKNFHFFLFFYLPLFHSHVSIAGPYSSPKVGITRTLFPDCSHFATLFFRYEFWKLSNLVNEAWCRQDRTRSVWWQLVQWLTQTYYSNSQYLWITPNFDSGTKAEEIRIQSESIGRPYLFQNCKLCWNNLSTYSTSNCYYQSSLLTFSAHI